MVNQLEARDYFCGYSEWMKVQEIVKSKREGIKFRLVGDNPGLSKPVSSETELNDIMKNCLCYVNTTRLSPLPMSLLEGMSCGCPVVSTANQQVPELLSGGVGISSNDLNVLADSIIRIYDDRKWAEGLGRNSRKKIEEEYGLQHFINKWNNAFDEAYNINVGKREEN